MPEVDKHLGKKKKFWNKGKVLFWLFIAFHLGLIKECKHQWYASVTQDCGNAQVFLTNLMEVTVQK